MPLARRNPRHRTHSKYLIFFGLFVDSRPARRAHDPACLQLPASIVQPRVAFVEGICGQVICLGFTLYETVEL